jgi:hypothetical protein
MGKGIAIGAGIVVVLAALAGGAFLLLGGDDEEGGGVEVYLEPADALGESPFSAQALGEAPNPELVAAPAPTAPDAPESVEVTTTSGTEPGLYGGTSGSSSPCATDQVGDLLAADPTLAGVWAAAFNSGPDLRWQGGALTAQAIPDYLATLTPAVLLADTRVTSHGVVGGQAEASQTILARGTGVLVDPFGLPRTKCASASPLLPPTASSGTVTYTGSPWQGFNPVDVDVIVAGQEAVEAFELTDPASGERYQRPVGTTGDQDGGAAGAEPNGPYTVASTTSQCELNGGECEAIGTAAEAQWDVSCTDGSCTIVTSGGERTATWDGTSLSYTVDLTTDAPYTCDGQNLTTTRTVTLADDGTGVLSGTSSTTADAVPPSCPNPFVLAYDMVATPG